MYIFGNDNKHTTNYLKTLIDKQNGNILHDSLIETTSHKFTIILLL